jgi:DNA-binding transcriptional LysR family regulator
MIGLKLIIPQLKGFARAYPDLRVHVDLSDAPVEKNDTRYDIHIRLGQVDDPNLVASRLARSRRILCASPSYVAEFGHPGSVEELAGHSCLLISGLGVDSNTWIFREGTRASTVRVQGKLVFNSGDGHYEAIVAGLGIGRVTEILARSDIASGRLVPVLTDRHASDPEPILALFPGGKHTPQKTRAFIEYARHSFRGFAL